MAIASGDAVKVEGYGGVAFRVIGNHVIDQDEDGECDFDMNQWDCHMVGDDRTYTFHTRDLKKLSEDDYCGGCGQIGCTAEKG